MRRQTFRELIRGVFKELEPYALDMAVSTQCYLVKIKLLFKLNILTFTSKEGIQEQTERRSRTPDYISEFVELQGVRYAVDTAACILPTKGEKMEKREKGIYFSLLGDEVQSRVRKVPGPGTRSGRNAAIPGGPLLRLLPRRQHLEGVRSKRRTPKRTRQQGGGGSRLPGG